MLPALKANTTIGSLRAMATVTADPMKVQAPVVPKLRGALGQTFTDAGGRTLHVSAVRPAAEDGREVIGEVLSGVQAVKKPYATDAVIFRAVWLERVPVWHPRKPGTH